MRAMRALLCLALAACDDLTGFSGEPPPLATFRVTLTGDVPDSELRVGLVYGVQWLPEPLCFLPPESPEVAAVVAAGCRDVLAFTPIRATNTVAIAPGQTAELPLFQLPSADVMVGDLTGRVAYGSLVVFDDIDGDGELAFAQPVLLPTGAFNGGNDHDDEDNEGTRRPDEVLGASFVSMTAPDRRVAFLEGEFFETGFYPRRGCGAPLPGFSILSAGGFTLDAAIAATLDGELPAQDPATCAEDDPETPIEIALDEPGALSEVTCKQRALDSSVRYRDPPAVPPPGFEKRAHACTSIPTLGEPAPATADLVQLVIASNNEHEPCKGFTHYTLVGCDGGELECDEYEWDLRANPPAWWPCE